MGLLSCKQYKQVIHHTLTPLTVFYRAMGAAQVSESYNAEDLEKGKDALGPSILHGLKRRSSVTLKAIARTFSVPGGKSVVRIPSQAQSQCPTLKEEQEKEVSATPRKSGCYSNTMSDAELTASEVTLEGTSGHSSGAAVVSASAPTKEGSGASSTC